jgi:hypothetical protein
MVSRSRNMGKFFLVASAAAVLSGFALIAPAAAQCWWTGLGSGCSAPPFAYHPPAYGGSAFGYYDRSRGLSPYAAYGAASHLGPDPGGGYLHAGASNIGHTD